MLSGTITNANIAAEINAAQRDLIHIETITVAITPTSIGMSTYQFGKKKMPNRVSGELK
ncbi:hypothetical protein SAMN05443249_3896 [Beijerinckia sp. 28-YEA-48]|nr:hypothetical protein SAMN05443249_3896 [Beijerinckia sp. 28-YEA-48]